MHLSMAIIMAFILALLALGFTAATAVPTNERIVGGTVTTIDRYPFAASLLYSWDLVYYSQSCAGTILTTRAILTAGHCLYGNSAVNWRVRVGSTWANSGGVVHSTALLTVHPGYSSATLDNDVAILRTATVISYVTNAVQAASIAGTNYNLADSQAVFAIGWGTTSVSGSSSEQLRQVQIWTVNQAICRSRYSVIGWIVTDNMLCSGWLDVGGRDQCQGDSGGPLIHNSVIVGVCSWGNQCALAAYPGVNTRVSRFTSWIQANA